jgi:gliding motility-associated-like protein
MKYIITLFILTFSIPNFAQVSSCFEIESILVDACAPSGQEGLNEMVRFQVGPAALNTTELNVIWATTSNDWTGTCQSQATSDIVSQLNSTIVSCGVLIEPVDGILPANSKVLLISSSSMDINSNSFAGLSDTLYIIFHCSNNTTGNFANYNSAGGLRFLTMSFNSPAGCSDVVAYDRSLLVNQSGNPGGADGATANFLPDGTASYTNNGCSAPFQPLDPTWVAPTSVCETEAPIDLTTLISGTQGGVWSGTGVSGSFFNPTGLSGPISINYTITAGSCITNSEQVIQVTAGGFATWTNPGNLCTTSGSIDLSLFVTGTLGGVFSGFGVSGSTFDPSGLEGQIVITYTVGAGACVNSAQQSINVSAGPDASWISPNNVCVADGPIQLSTLLTGSAGGVWSGNGTVSGVFNPAGNLGANSITYTVIVGGCESSVTQDLLVSPVATSPIITGNTSFCVGGVLPILSSSSGENSTWYSDAALSQQVASSANFQVTDVTSLNYWVVAGSGTCQSQATSVTLSLENPISVEISSSEPLVWCGPTNAILSSSLPNGNVWSTGETTQTIVIDQPGVYSVSNTGECNTASDEITVLDASIDVTLLVSTESGTAPLSVDVTTTSDNADVCVLNSNGLPLSIISGSPAVFLTEGQFVLTYLCTNSQGCSSSVSRTINVTSGAISIDFPNSFTPNGDGYNDFFKAETSGISELRTSVFNRWGEKVVEWQGSSGNWDGSNKLGQSPDGVYFFVAFAKDINGLTIEKHGSITLIR